MKESFVEEGYSTENFSGDIHDFVMEQPYYFPNGTMRGEIDFMGFDEERDRAIAVEVKPHDKPGHIKQAYYQLWKDEVYFSNVYPDKEIITCMKLGDKPLKEVVAMNEADLRKEMVRYFENNGSFNTITENKRFYREDGSQRGVVSVFAEDIDNEKIALCNVAVYAKESLCQSAIERAKNEVENLTHNNRYSGWEINPYVYVNGIGKKEIEIVDEDYEEPEVNYKVIEDIMNEAPRWAIWAPNI